MTMYRRIKSKLYVSFNDLIKQYLSSHAYIDIIMPQNAIRLINTNVDYNENNIEPQLFFFSEDINQL